MPTMLASGRDRAVGRHRTEPGDAETRYRYDEADQLLSAEAGGREIVRFSYDSSGRLTEEREGGRRRVIDYDGFGLPVGVTRMLGGRREHAQAVFNGDGLLSELQLRS
jgi:YD repeat-containing protein